MSDPINPATGKPIGALVDEVAEQLKTRAGKSDLRAKVFLILLFSVLTLGVLAIVYSSSLVKGDFKSQAAIVTQRSQAKQELLVKNQDAINKIRSKLGAYKEKAATLLSGRGHLWEKQSADNITRLSTIHVDDVNSAWIGGRSGRLKRTTDGGKSWMEVGPRFLEGLNSIDFSNGNKQGIAVGEKGLIIKRDEYKDWTIVSRGDQGALGLVGLLFIGDGLEGVALSKNGEVYKSGDLGKTWQYLTQLDGLDYTFLEIEPSTGDLFAGGGEGLWQSKDNGVTWDKVVLPKMDQSTYLYSAKYHPDINKLVVTATGGDNYKK
jgi:photosystem II stability/assembly factor-like uncharacterized protein